MKDYDAYLFDADGTLIDTKGMILQSFLNMGKELGVTLPPVPDILATIGLPVRPSMEIILGKGHDDAYYDKAMRLYGDFLARVYKDSIRLFPGVAEGLARLRALGKKLAVVSSRRRESLVSFLTHLDIARHFTVLVTPEDTPDHKPDPGPARHALKLLGAEPARAVFIGDAGFDILCGQRAGTDAAFVVWGGNPVDGLPSRPEFVAERFADLLPDSAG